MTDPSWKSGSRRRSISISKSAIFHWQDPARLLEEADAKLSYTDLITGKTLGVPESDIDNAWRDLFAHLKESSYTSASNFADTIYALVNGSHPQLIFGKLPSKKWSGVRLCDRAKILSAIACSLAQDDNESLSAAHLTDIRVRALTDEFPMDIRVFVSELLERLGGHWTELDEGAIKFASAGASSPLGWNGSGWSQDGNQVPQPQDFATHPLAESGRVGVLLTGLVDGFENGVVSAWPSRTLTLEQMVSFWSQRFNVFELLPEQVLSIFGESLVAIVPVRKMHALADKIERAWNMRSEGSGFAAVAHDYSLLEMQYGFSQIKQGSFGEITNQLKRLYEERILGCPDPNRRQLSTPHIDHTPFFDRCSNCKTVPILATSEGGMCSYCAAEIAADESTGKPQGRSTGLLCCRPCFAGLSSPAKRGIADWVHVNERVLRAVAQALEAVVSLSKGSRFIIGESFFVSCDREDLFEIAFQISDQIERAFAKQPAPGPANAFERYTGGYHYSGAPAPSMVCGVGLIAADEITSVQVNQAMKLADSACRVSLLTSRSSIDYWLESTNWQSDPIEYRRRHLEQMTSGEDGTPSTLSMTGRPYSLIEMQGLIRSAMRIRQSELSPIRLQQLSQSMKAGRMKGTLEYLYMRARAGRHKDIFRNLDEWWHGGASSPEPYRAGRVNGILRYETFIPDAIELMGFLRVGREGAEHATSKRS